MYQLIGQLLRSLFLNKRLLSCNGSEISTRVVRSLYRPLSLVRYILIKVYDHRLSRSALAVARTHVDGLQVIFNAERLKLKQDIDELKCSSQEVYYFNEAEHTMGRFLNMFSF